MMKLIYSALVLMLFSAAFLFSKEKEEHPCQHSMTGKVTEIKDAAGFHLCIETPDHKIFQPIIDKADVVLASGTSVRVCYEAVGDPEASMIRINHVSYLP
jgi:hypothetical protein